MPYRRTSALPKSVQSLPEHAKRIYLEAFNNAWKQYEDPRKRRMPSSREVTARKVAWGAVKKIYRKEDGEWLRRSESD